jgi:hypothetical protein
MKICPLITHVCVTHGNIALHAMRRAHCSVMRCLAEQSPAVGQAKLADTTAKYNGLMYAKMTNIVNKDFTASYLFIAGRSTMTALGLMLTVSLGANKTYWIYRWNNTLDYYTIECRKVSSFKMLKPALKF